MLFFSRSKILAITLVCLLSLFYSIPTFIPQNNESKFLEKIKAFFPEQQVNLGLDLRGGSQLMLEVNFDYYLKEQVNILKEDLKIRFREESIRTIPAVQNNEIIFSLNDEEQKKSAKKLIRKLNKQMEIEESGENFRVFFSKQELKLMRDNLVKQSIEIVRRRIDENGTKEPTIQSQGENRILLQVPGAQNADEIKSVLGKTAKMTFHFVSDETFTNANLSSTNPNLEKVYDNQGRSYLIEREVILSGDLLIDAAPTYHEGNPAVSFRFNDIGARKFADITKNNIGKFFAIVLDDKIVTAPRINTIINQGSGVISGSFTDKETTEVALLLRAGALPAPLEIVEERTVGPSLGLDSVKSGTLAAFYGLLLVALFMIIFYGFFGFIADIAMFFNITMILSALAILGATLTLPGIAGIVLTMGMSVDANVLIFERIKEELREKKSNFVAVEQGFSQAFRTITDSNITTLIVAFFLYAFGNGSIKGFAVTLSIGILSSMFTAILLTRLMISLWLKKNKTKKLNLI